MVNVSQWLTSDTLLTVRPVNVRNGWILDEQKFLDERGKKKRLVAGQAGICISSIQYAVSHIDPQVNPSNKHGKPDQASAMASMALQAGYKQSEPIMGTMKQMREG